MLNESTLKVFRLAIPDEESGGESGDGNMRDFHDTELILSGYLEIASAEFAAINDGEYGKFYRFFVDDFEADVREGDKLVDADDGGLFYLVSGVQKTNKGPGRKMEIICHLPKS